MIVKKLKVVFFRMGLSVRMLVGIVFVLTQLVHGALCWGKDGHYTVCKIAEVSSFISIRNDLYECRCDGFDA